MIVILVISLLLPQITYANDPSGKTNKDPEVNMSVPEVIRYDGYPVEVYDVVTEDGYILYLFRIPHGKNNSDSPRKATPVYFQHGLLADCSCWIFDLPNKTLPYILADKGYDVWLGNYRGCKYGRRHKTLDPDKFPFWLFSFDEMGKFDIPAITDFILEKTGASQVHYIGHSMGTTGAFITLSSKPEYNDKFRSFNALAPVGKLDHCKAPLIQAVAPLSDQLILVIGLLGGYEFPPYPNYTQIPVETTCKSEITNNFCSTTVFLFAGFDYEQFNETRIPVYAHFFPSGTSAQTIQHYGQILKSHRFQFYDYGNRFKNYEKYGQTFPPKYDLTKITTRVALYTGDNDWLAQPADVKYIIEQLPNESLVLNYRVPFEKWNHVDFVWARDVNDLLYKTVIETLETVWPDA